MRSIFMERSCRKCAPKASPRPLLILVNNPKQSLHARNSFRNKNVFISYILSDQIWWYKSVFELFQKLHLQIYASQFMQHHKLFHFHLSFWIWKVWKGKKIQQSEYLENEKSFLDEIKSIFHRFSGAIIWWKNENLIKTSGHKLWQ